MKLIVFRCARCGIHLVNDPQGHCIVCAAILNNQSRPKYEDLVVLYCGVA